VSHFNTYRAKCGTRGNVDYSWGLWDDIWLENWCTSRVDQAMDWRGEIARWMEADPCSRPLQRGQAGEEYSRRYQESKSTGSGDKKDEVIQSAGNLGPYFRIRLIYHDVVLVVNSSSVHCMNTGIFNAQGICLVTPIIELGLFFLAIPSFPNIFQQALHITFVPNSHLPIVPVHNNRPFQRIGILLSKLMNSLQCVRLV